MSLINRVLNQLERRGVHTTHDQTLIRSVPAQNEQAWIKPALAGAAILAAVVVLLWLWPKHQVPVIEELKIASEVVAAPVFTVPDVVRDVSNLPVSKLSFELSEVPQAVREKASPAPITPSDVVVQQVVPKSFEPRPLVEKLAEAKLVETKPPAVVAQSLVELPIKQVSGKQQADAEYRKALLLQQQGHGAEALAGFEAALKLNSQHELSRLALAALLMDNRRGADAERTLQGGLALKPTHTGFSMALARVQVERGKIDQALETLQQNLNQAEDKADFQAFYAALLQRQERHIEAVSHYQIAVKLAPSSGVWLMGYGISLQAIGRNEDAKIAYQQALATQTLSPELTAFVQQKLNGF